MDSLFTQMSHNGMARVDLELTPDAALELAARLVEGVRRQQKEGRWPHSFDMAGTAKNEKPKKGEPEAWPGLMRFTIASRESK